jgi:hypothetical protein
MDCEENEARLESFVKLMAKNPISGWISVPVIAHV